MGLMTHYADSYVNFKLPENGEYYVHLSDVQNHGGKEYGYRLRISPPRPDFAVYVTPSSLNIPAGRTTSICVHAFRKEGFTGDIDVELKNAPDGFKLSGNKIAANIDKIRMTVTSPNKNFKQPIALQLESHAVIDGNMVSRMVCPAEDMMQAFAYRHLVSSQELLAAVTDTQKFTPIFESTNATIKIPAGGTAELRIKMEKKPMLRDIKFELNEPPKGITIENVTATFDEITLTLKADKNASAGLKDNLIIDAFTEQIPRQANPKNKNKQQRIWLGVLPAIPIEIVQQ